MTSSPTANRIHDDKPTSNDNLAPDKSGPELDDGGLNSHLNSDGGLSQY